MTRGSLLVRGIIAVLLMVGFYALALGIAGGLLWLVYAQVVLAGQVYVKMVLVCLWLAGMILWAVFPRPDRFTPPGPELAEEEHPRLFELIREVAAQTGQAAPSEVYLVADVNAFVAQRGGFMGFSSRRVMGIGLPLLSLLTVTELRGVLAHEFGHFHGGDTMVGPWIYKTRGAIGRTIVSLARGGSRIVRLPFEWYGSLFLKITHSISRAQELAADALAARIVGTAPMVRGLKATHGGASAYGAYLEHEFVPVLRAGFRPPLAEGFREFVDVKKVKASLEKLVNEELESDAQDPVDTHPPLAVRVEALEALDLPSAEDDGTSAVELIAEPDALEERLFQRSDDGPLKPLAWSKVARRVLLPQWRKAAEAVVGVLGPTTLSALARSGSNFATLGGRVTKGQLAAGQARLAGANFAAAAMATTLADAGWTIKNRVGRAISLRQGELKLSPFEDCVAVTKGELTVEALVDRLTAAGVAELTVPASNQAE